MDGLAGLIDLKVNRQVYGLAAQRTQEICGLVGIHGKTHLRAQRRLKALENLSRSDHCREAKQPRLEQ